LARSDWILEKFRRDLAKVIKFGQNQTLASPKTSTVGAGDAAASPKKNFWAKFGRKLWKIWQIWANLIKIWANLIKFEQNQNLASPKTFYLLRLTAMISWSHLTKNWKE